MSYTEMDRWGRPYIKWDRHGRAHCVDCGQLLQMAGGIQADYFGHDCPENPDDEMEEEE